MGTLVWIGAQILTQNLLNGFIIISLHKHQTPVQCLFQWSPFMYLTPDGDYRGLCWELINALAQAFNFT